MPARLAFPLRRSGVRLASVEQGTAEHAASQVLAVLTTPRGWWDAEPDLGLPDLAWEPAPIDPQIVADQVDAYVDAAGLDVLVTERPDLLDEQTRIVGVQVTDG